MFLGGHPLGDHWMSTNSDDPPCRFTADGRSQSGGASWVNMHRDPVFGPAQKSVRAGSRTKTVHDIVNTGPEQGTETSDREQGREQTSGCRGRRR